ncbi:MAG TPA: hypothetical protein VKY62_13795, partial [Devosia sp.]|nr:hypothetical protein [Devosia sp.]
LGRVRGQTSAIPPQVEMLYSEDKATVAFAGLAGAGHAGVEVGAGMAFWWRNRRRHSLMGFGFHGSSRSECAQGI